MLAKLKSRAPSPFAIAGGTAAVLLLFAERYGYHRDELYFLAAGDRLAWGYADQGPFTPAVARLMNELAPDSLLVLRLPSAVAAGATVLLTGMLARELGGGRRGQAIASACAAAAAIVLITAHWLSTSTFDLLAWAAISWLAVRAVRTGDDRLWVAAGLVLGLALLNKPLPAFLAAGLLVGVVVAGPRRLLRSPWVWAGALLALAVWSPWLAWQADNGWPQLEVAEEISAGGSASSQPRWAFLPFQLLLVGPLLAPVWIAGVVRLFRDPDLRPVRFLGWTWIVLAAVFLATGGKPYYLAGLLPLLLAAGAVPVDRWLERGRAQRRRRALGGAVAANALVAATIALPVLPADRSEPVVAVNPDVGETVGWRELARTVGRVRDGASQKRRIVVFTANYGEAGAIDRYGGALGLPPAHSGHNAYGDWGPPQEDGGPVVVVGLRDVSPFRGCRLAARLHNDAGVDNDEHGAPVWSCAGTRRPWAQLWPALRRLG